MVRIPSSMSRRLFALALCLSASLPPNVEAAAKGPHVARYRHDRDAAFSFTFDDGWKVQVENTLAIIDPLEIKGTFFLMPLAMKKRPQNHPSWERVREIQANGHEIGTHAKVRPRLHESDGETLDRIINGGHDLIAEKTGVPPVSFAKPGGSKFTPKVAEVVYENHAFVRRPNTFAKEAQVVGYGHHKWRPWKEARERRRVEKTIAEHKWRVAYVHAIIKGYAAFPSKDAFRSICTYLKEQARQGRLWIAPMGTVGRYIAARRESDLKVHEFGAGSCRFSLSCPDTKRDLFTEPLTVVVPAQVTDARAETVGGEALPVQIREDSVLVDVLPGSGPVEVKW